eukprot:10026843-Alexandrium_andersonii.AAC.1
MARLEEILAPGGAPTPLPLPGRLPRGRPVEHRPPREQEGGRGPHAPACLGVHSGPRPGARPCAAPCRNGSCRWPGGRGSLPAA